MHSYILRRKLLWILGSTAAMFAVALIDGLLMLRDPSRGSFLNMHVDDVRALVRTAGIVVLVSLASIGLILTFWKSDKPGNEAR
jgi:hypothetical protein